MASEELVAAIKKIAGLLRGSKTDEAYKNYQTLFENPKFQTFPPNDQRQALKLMVLVKRHEPPTQTILDAHRAAVGPLTELVSRHGEAADHEMLGICHVLLGNNDSAAAIFRAGLKIERDKNAGSDLCGSLMSRLSAL
jgi:hypothetical protein